MRRTSCLSLYFSKTDFSCDDLVKYWVQSDTIFFPRVVPNIKKSILDLKSKISFLYVNLVLNLFWVRQIFIKLQICLISFNSSNPYWCCLLGLPLCLCMVKCSTMLKSPPNMTSWVWHKISLCQRRFSAGGGGGGSGI